MSNLCRYISVVILLKLMTDSDATTIDVWELQCSWILSSSLGWIPLLKKIFIPGFLPDDMFIFVSVSSIFNIYIYCEAIYFRHKFFLSRIHDKLSNFVFRATVYWEIFLRQKHHPIKFLKFLLKIFKNFSAEKEVICQRQEFRTIPSCMKIHTLECVKSVKIINLQTLLPSLWLKKLRN